MDQSEMKMEWDKLMSSMNKIDEMSKNMKGMDMKDMDMKKIEEMKMTWDHMMEDAKKLQGMMMKTM